MSALIARAHTALEVRSLYRELLRAGKKLEHTDHAWYRRTLRAQFDKHRDKPDNALYVQVRLPLPPRPRPHGLSAHAGCSTTISAASSSPPTLRLSYDWH